MPLFLTSGRDYGSLRAPASSDSASLMAPVTDESELAPKVPVGQWTFTHTHTTLNASVGFFQWHIIQATFRPWKEFDWRFNLAISGLHFFKSRAVHQPRSIQDPFATERRVLSHPSLHSCPRRLRRTSAGRHRSFMTWSFSWASFIINIAIYSFIMNHPSMLTYIYILCFSEFLFKFCSGSDRMASVCGSMFKSLGSNMWTNRNEWGTRLIQKGKFPRIDQVDSEKQKARNSQTFALKSLSLQIPLVLQLQSLLSRFWKIHCGILWKRIQCGHLSNSWCASHLAEKKSYTCLLEFHRWYLVDTVIFMRRNCNDYDWTYWTCKTFVAKEQTFPVACSFCSRYEGGTPRVAIGLEA